MSSFPRHQRSREVSLEDHVRSAQITLGERLTGKVYLDSNYWINLQQATKRCRDGHRPRQIARDIAQQGRVWRASLSHQHGHFSGIDEAS